ncbi:MAG: c-type cytochrome [Xylophilus ampelinus]
MSDIHVGGPPTGPIKNPKQLLIASLFAFVVPVLVIIGLVYFVTSANKPEAGASNMQQSIEQRLRRVGSVEIRDANRPLQTGEAVFQAQCATCHAAGVAGAPKFGDAAAWAPRIGQGYAALLNSALHGKGAMAPQGGGDFEDVEIGRAVVYMANAGGAKFPEPQRAAAQADAAGAAAAPAPATATAAAATPGPASDPAAAAPQPVPAAASGPAAAAPAAAAATAGSAPQVAAAPQAAGANAAAGEALYKQTCAVCHAAGVAGAPKLGDKAAWAPRIAQGVDHITQLAMKGIGAMPPKGGSNASDADFRAAVEYMVNAAK